jgi:hypothetical protein
LAGDKALGRLRKIAHGFNQIIEIHVDFFIATMLRALAVEIYTPTPAVDLRLRVR